jgi:hypothetical protein
MPRSKKTPGRAVRDVARATASRARKAAPKRLRDQPHVSRRSKAWWSMAELRRRRRLLDTRRFAQLGRAGAGQSRNLGPRTDFTHAKAHAQQEKPPGAMARDFRRAKGGPAQRRSRVGARH